MLEKDLQARVQFIGEILIYRLDFGFMGIVWFVDNTWRFIREVGLQARVWFIGDYRLCFGFGNN